MHKYNKQINEWINKHHTQNGQDIVTSDYSTEWVFLTKCLKYEC